METVALVLRLGLVGLFAIAGIAKLSNRENARTAMRDFGLPDWTVTTLGITLPTAELAAALLLVPVATVFWGGLEATALLLIFSIAIGINLVKGRKPKCNCFGQLHADRIGWSTLIRNGVLTGCASFVLLEAWHSTPQSALVWSIGVSRVATITILLWVAAIVLMSVNGWLTLHLLRQNGRLLLRMDAIEGRTAEGGGDSRRAPSGLPIGSAAPNFALPVLSDGSLVTLEALRAKRHPVMLIFSDPNCGPCSALLPEIARWELDFGSTVTVVLISRGAPEVNRIKLGDHAITHVLLQKDREVTSAYLASGTPSAVLVGANGTLMSELAMGAQEIGRLVTRARNEPLQEPAALRIGDSLPALTLQDIRGNAVVLTAMAARRKTLLLFWNPGCRFCSDMLPDLKSWEDQHPSGAPSLLVISSGTAAANRGIGLKSSVLMDPTFSLGRAFHVAGTPAAVLIDGNGKVASHVANGAPAVLVLGGLRNVQGSPDRRMVAQTL